MQASLYQPNEFLNHIPVWITDNDEAFGFGQLCLERGRLQKMAANLVNRDKPCQTVFDFFTQLYKKHPEYDPHDQRMILIVLPYFHQQNMLALSEGKWDGFVRCVF